MGRVEVDGASEGSGLISEIQLKSPNWLFGQRKYEESGNAVKTVANDRSNATSQDVSLDSCDIDLKWLFSQDDVCEDLLQRSLEMEPGDAADSWYSGKLIYDQDVHSKAYQHYAQFCQGSIMDPFERDPEKENHYAEALHMGLDSTNYALVTAEMEAALKEYDEIGSELRINFPCRSLVDDPSWLARWIVGEDLLKPC